MKNNIKVSIIALNMCRPMTGVGRYISDLSNLSKEIDLTAIIPNKIVKINNNFKKIKSYNYHGKYGKLFFSFRKHKTEPNTILHFPQPLVSIFEREKKIIVTIHDVLYKDLPRFYSLRERILLELSTRIALWKADEIICVSNYTKERLLKYYSPKVKIHVVYNPVDRIETQEINQEKYFICISNKTPRKNISNTIEGFLNSKYYHSGYKLVLCGTNDGRYNNFNDPQIEDRNYVTDIELNQLISKSKALLFFSYGEGFGYPILEATKYNVPVLAANNSSILELFNYRSDLLCNNYYSSSGITEFLDYFFDNPDLYHGIKNILNDTLIKCSRDRFEEKMKAIYYGIKS